MKAIQYQDFSNDINSSRAIVDPLEDYARCARDIPYFKALNINTIYVHHIRPHSSHSDCMRLLRDAGIYVLLNLGGKLGTESRTFRWEYPLADRFRTIATEFAPFSNLLGFRIVGSAPSLLPFTKAAVRDIRSHLSKSRLRAVPIGFDSFEDIPNDRELYDYLGRRCGYIDDAVDFWFYSPDFQKCLDAENFLNVVERIKPLKGDLPVLMSGSACDMPPEGDTKLLQTAYSKESLEIHSGVSLFSYFDSDFAILKTRPGTVF